MQHPFFPPNVPDLSSVIAPLNNPQQDKLKQREALENAYGNFVEPHFTSLVVVRPESSEIAPLTPAATGCTSGWLLLTLVYCLGLRWLGRSA